MKDYIKKDTTEWEEFIKEIISIKSKSNRQVLCVKCWVLLNYEQKIKHIKYLQDHEKYILTSSKFASAWQISSLALACNKIVYKPDGEYIRSPFQEMIANNPTGIQGNGSQQSPQLNEALVLSAVNEVAKEENSDVDPPQVEESKEEQVESDANQNRVPTLEKLDEKIKILQNSIDSIKILFTQVLERLNIVNEENNFLRCMLIQQQSNMVSPYDSAPPNQNQAQINIHSYQNREESNLDLVNQLPSLNHSAVQLNNQIHSFQNNQTRNADMSEAQRIISGLMLNSGLTQNSRQYMQNQNNNY